MPTIDRNDETKENASAKHSNATVSEGERSIRFAGSELGVKRHICGFFNSADEEYRTLLPFIKEGLERGEKAFHVVSPDMSDEHLRRLASFDIDVAGLAQGKQLELCDWDEVYFPDGRFDQDRMLAMWQSVLDGAKQQGFPATRLVAHMEWALEDRDGVNDLLEYEARFNQVHQGDRDSVICAYDIAKFRGDIIVDIIRTHPMIIIGGILQENPFFVPPDEFLRELRERKATQAAHN
jgi:MEDS: MEthanogen/methylotroph, DcmR Sensory domain